MREEFDGKLLELSYKHDNEITLAIDDIYNWHISQLQSVFEEIEKTLEMIFDEKFAKKLGDDFEKIWGVRNCKMCGYPPEKQREIIFNAFNSLHQKYLGKEKE